MRRALLKAAMLAALAMPAQGLAQDRDETLADIRQELTVLFVEIQRLNRELSTTGGAATAGGAGGDVLQRVDLIEAELQRLTSKTEELEFRIGSVVRDGTNRIGDLEFRLCELEPGCDVGSLGETFTLGGALEGVETPAVTPQADDTQLAVGEQADFDLAKTAFEAGDFRGAADGFQTFTDTYTGGPLTGEAHFLRGQALAELGETSGAARAYLASFSGDPNGPRAADALLQLGASLASLGQTEEACVTLGEVSARFPDAAQVGAAETERQRLGCS